MRNIRIQSLMVANLSCVAQTGLESMLPIGTPRKPFQQTDRRDRPLVAFGTVMFDLGGIGIVVFDPYPASPSMKPVTFFPYLLGGWGVKWWKSLLSPQGGWEA